MKQRKRKRGFTLIEGMIAVAIVGLGFVSTVALLTKIRIHNDLEQERTRAHQIVSEEMERIRLELFTRLRPSEQVTVWDNGTPDDPTDDTVGTLEVTMIDINGVELTAPPTTTGSRVSVEVTMTWNPRGSSGVRTLTETLMMYVTP